MKRNRFESVSQPQPKTEKEVFYERMGELQAREKQLQEELVKIRRELNLMGEQAQEEEEAEIMS